DKPGAPVLDRARELGVDTFVFSAKDYASKADYEAESVKRLDALKVDLVCLAGYMRIVGETLLQAYEGKIINIHPSLLPAFRGAHAVEQAVAYGVKVYGITIHWVNSDLDGGKIIAQRAFPYEGSDPAEVHAIGQKIEHELYVETINKVLCER
ncbi:MAG: phosphoribosylglycinamide formyltransferase, partial [Bacteroidales bacterium]|nr:phosphoribosylglycinamide formyltransferase [Bacteroidales bacterium]